MALSFHKIPSRGNWRILIRFSLDYDKSSAVRNAIAPLLKKCGIRRTRTGT
jgi:hypothetical protein